MCSGLAVFLASMVEGEMAWRLLGWDGFSTQCAKAISGMRLWSVGRVPLYWSVTLIPQLDHLGGCSHDRCVVVDPLDACRLVLGSVLPRVIEDRYCTIPTIGMLYSLRVVLLYHLYSSLNTIRVRHAS
jgi:hypothetical protein